MLNRITRTIVFPEDERKPSFIDNNYSLELFSWDDMVRAGFEKGTLEKITFELHTGHKIIFEEKTDLPQDSHPL